MYTHLAHLYDWPGSLDLSDHLIHHWNDLLTNSGIQPPSSLLDLACGTGEIPLALAQLGWQVTGLDVSPAMLTLAQKKSEQLASASVFSAGAPRWCSGDMTALDKISELSPASYRGISCLSDSVNHLLTPDEVQSLFQGVFTLLQPDGIFAFDVNTHQAFVELWEGHDMSEGPNFRLKVDATFDESTGRAEAKFVAEEHVDTDDDEDATPYTETEDIVQEQFYDVEDLKFWLAEAGFIDIKTEPYTPLDILEADAPLKTWIWCRKP